MMLKLDVIISLNNKRPILFFILIIFLTYEVISYSINYKFYLLHINQNIFLLLFKDYKSITLLSLDYMLIKFLWFGIFDLLRPHKNILINLSIYIV